MSQEQPRRPQPGQDPIKYGDVFDVSGDLAKKPIAPEDAAMMQSAETRVLGQTQLGGAASVMQSAATQNEQAGLVGHLDVNDVASDRGVTVSETRVPGRRIITEAVGGKVVQQYAEPTPVQTGRVSAVGESAITIGEALEATAQTVGHKAVDQSDASAIQAAEVRATGNNVTSPGGLAAMAQSAAAYNADCTRDEDKVKLGDVLGGATAKLAADKAVTMEDAERVASAELRNNPDETATPGGVAASVAAAARINENVGAF
ncbi:late embryogenesis abundant protein D-34-like [Vigna unguiculata]|uniref:Seed maturation protein n=1 Tax=Vigna unguiculata TaxID=3917 RepID=A0A4D6N628_VIGUN|nr:late embryogenesis abundant protein D-34-like [Vigna unguiculata]QCE08331.1 Seed maturation protein [Vigna unguiculata]